MSDAETLTAAIVEYFLLGYMSAVVLVVFAIWARPHGRG